MEAKYIRESNDHYLALPVSEVPAGDYQLPMLLQNRIPGLLPVHMQTIDGVSTLYYEVTSYRTLSSSFESEKLNLNMILKILLHMSRMADEIDRYLLKGNAIVMDPEYVFVSMDKMEICFCYDPCCRETGAMGLNSMARFILDHIDYEDRTCTSLAYSLFQESMKECVSIADFAKLALGHETEDSGEMTTCSKEELVTGNFQDLEVVGQEKQTGVTVGENRYLKTWKKSAMEIVIRGCLNTVFMAAFFGGIGILHTYLTPGSKEMIAISVTGLWGIEILIAAAGHYLTGRMIRDKVSCEQAEE